MKTQKRKTPEEKEKILSEIKKMGVVEGCSHFKISANTYYNWRNQYASRGLKGLMQVKSNEQADVIRELEEKTRLLEEILIEKELTIKMQQDLLKKNLPLWKKGKR